MLCGSDPNGPAGSVSRHPQRRQSDKVAHLHTRACAHTHADTQTVWRAVDTHDGGKERQKNPSCSQKNKTKTGRK